MILEPRLSFCSKGGLSFWPLTLSLFSEVSTSLPNSRPHLRFWQWCILLPERRQSYMFSKPSFIFLLDIHGYSFPALLTVRVGPYDWILVNVLNIWTWFMFFPGVTPATSYEISWDSSFLFWIKMESSSGGIQRFSSSQRWNPGRWATSRDTTLLCDPVDHHWTTTGITMKPLFS